MKKYLPVRHAVPCRNPACDAYVRKVTMYSHLHSSRYCRMVCRKAHSATLKMEKLLLNEPEPVLVDWNKTAGKGGMFGAGVGNYHFVSPQLMGVISNCSV